MAPSPKVRKRETETETGRDGDRRHRHRERRLVCRVNRSVPVILEMEKEHEVGRVKTWINLIECIRRQQSQQLIYHVTRNQGHCTCMSVFEGGFPCNPGYNH